MPSFMRGSLCHGIQDFAANMAAIKNSADHITLVTVQTHAPN